MVTPAEYFVAWLSGFSVGVTDRPTGEQWQHIMRALKGATVDVLPVVAPPTPTTLKAQQPALSRDQLEAMYRSARL